MVPYFPEGIEGVEFFFPDGPLSAYENSGDARTWGTGDFEHKEIAGLDRTIYSIMDLLNEHGPFIGVIGFSTGAAIAAIITSLLERHDRCPMFEFQVRGIFP
jgi:hypothetical protein